ncbi:unnamed protein product [Thelazia callipaeda]|uniref:Ovule protein n=1 Tax=Thelazia callipaeda TaxID=103827 RepID=A0A0N5DA99_THECL|nr:unnamed protein product [Thelazia callipaeda]
MSGCKQNYNSIFIIVNGSDWNCWLVELVECSSGYGLVRSPIAVSSIPSSRGNGLFLLSLLLYQIFSFIVDFD